MPNAYLALSGLSNRLTHRGAVVRDRPTKETKMAKPYRSRIDKRKHYREAALTRAKRRSPKRNRLMKVLAAIPTPDIKKMADTAKSMLGFKKT